MTSAIDPTVPVFGSPTTASVRNNFLIAKNEITALQNAVGITLPLPVVSGGTGANNAAGAAANLGVLPLSGGTMTGQILLTVTPTDNRSAVPKSYVDGMFPVAITNGGTGATSAVQALQNLGAVGLNSPAFTGVPTAPTPPTSDSSTIIATTNFVHNVISALPVGVTQLNVVGTGLTASAATGNINLSLNTPVTILNGGTGASTAVAALNNLGGAPLASPVFTGVPAAPTAPPTTNSTQIATCAFVTAAIASAVAGVSSITAGAGIAVTPPTGVGNVTVSLQTPVTIANGGTGATTGNAAFDSLLGGISSGSGFITRQTGGAYSITPATLTPANRPLIINASNAITTSSITTDNGTTFGVSGPMTVGGTLSGVSATFSGNAGISGTLAVSGGGTSSIAGTLDLTNALVSGNLTVDGDTIMGLGGQTTGQLLNVNGNSSPVQISAVTGSALNVRVDNAIPLLYFLFQTSTNVGTITTNGSATAYNTSSDARLKEEIKPADIYQVEEILDQIEPVEFEWRDNKSLGRVFGFLAQDVNEHYPQAVTPGEGEPGEPNFRPWSIDNSAFVPLLVAEARAVQQRILKLEAELAAIKEAINTPAPPPAEPTKTPTPAPSSRRR